MKSMTNKVFLITGSTNGIGKLTAIDLASQQKDATILIHGRNKEKLEKSMSEIQRASGNPNIESWLADFSSMNEVGSLA